MIVESPGESISFQPLATEDPDSIIKDPEQPRQQQQITSSFRRTIRHLQEVGGFRARFRGVSIFLINGFCINSLTQLVHGLPYFNMIPAGISQVIATVALARFSLTWTHIVISEPSPKAWFRRLPTWASWKKVAGPTAVRAIAEQVAVWVPVAIAISSGLGDNSTEDLANMTPHQKSMMSLEIVAIGLLAIVLGFGLVIPANVILTRVQASLLPDSEESIVPFDRSFGGKVIPEIVGGSGVLSMYEAWKTFEGASRIRLVKAYVKVFAMQFAVTCMFLGVLVLQLAIFGRDWVKVVPTGGN